MEKLTIINHEMNVIPDALEKRIALNPLLPGQTIKITINPSKKKTVRMQTGKEHSDTPDPRSGGRIAKSGAKMLCQHWTVMFDNKPIKCGFVTGMDGQNNPKFARIFFNAYGEIIVTGGKKADEDFWRLWQIHPENRWNVLNWDSETNQPKEARNWLGQAVDTSKERKDLFVLEQYTLNLKNKAMSGLSDADVCKLMAKDAPYGFDLYSQPYLDKDPQSARAFILERINKGPGLNGYKEFEAKLSNLEAIIDITAIHSAIIPGEGTVLAKWKVSDSEIRWVKDSGRLIAELKKPIGHENNPSERAKEIYLRLKGDSVFRMAVKEAADDHKAAKAASKKAITA